MDILLIILSLTGLLSGAIREVIRFRKDIYNPFFYRWNDENDKGFLKFFVILLITLPLNWIENPDYKRASMVLIICLLLLVINILNWLFIFKPSANAIKRTRVIVIQTIIVDILLIGSLLYLL